MTVTIQTTVSTISPVTCAPWCIDGTGHRDAEEPDEQSCYAQVQRIPLARTPNEFGDGARGLLTVQLYRDAFDDGRGEARLRPPQIDVYAGDIGSLTLSVGEARTLAALLTELADTADAG